MPKLDRVTKLQPPLISMGISLAAGGVGFLYRPAFAVSIVATLVAIVLLVFALVKPSESKNAGTEMDEPSTPSSSSGRDLESSQTHLGSDPETGFITFPVFSAILEAKVATGRRRLWPVTVVQIHLTFNQAFEPSESETSAAVITFAALMRLTLREADVCARIGRSRFALILEDTDEEGGAWVAERVQVAHVRSGASMISKISAGVAGYPTNGAIPSELFSRSTMALEHALMAQDEPGVGRVVVAPTVPYKG